MIPNDPSDKLNQNQGDISIPWGQNLEPLGRPLHVDGILIISENTFPIYFLLARLVEYVHPNGICRAWRGIPDIPSTRIRIRIWVEVRT